MYHLILSFSIWLFLLGAKYTGGIDNRIDIVRWWTVRVWEEQREREVRFPSKFISRRDYQTGADTSPSLSRTTILVSVTVSVLSVKGISYATLAHTHTFWSVIPIHTHTHICTITNERKSAGDLYFRYASRLERRGGWWGTKTDGGRQTSLLYLLSPILHTREERGRCGKRREPAEPVWRTSTGFIKPRL